MKPGTLIAPAAIYRTIPSHGEKDQCCILPTDNARFLGKVVRIPAAEVFCDVVRCAGCPGQKGGVDVALTPNADTYAPKVKEMVA